MSYQVVILRRQGSHTFFPFLPKTILLTVNGRAKRLLGFEAVENVDRRGALGRTRNIFERKKATLKRDS